MEYNDQLKRPMVDTIVDGIVTIDTRNGGDFQPGGRADFRLAFNPLSVLLPTRCRLVSTSSRPELLSIFGTRQNGKYRLNNIPRKNYNNIPRLSADPKKAGIFAEEGFLSG
ncbi:MAG: hypothetical protein O2985_12500, partial [Proteobacteria bacterium]|nr:hypothetical protein [Pseudomonadota bacterium]